MLLFKLKTNYMGIEIVKKNVKKNVKSVDAMMKILYKILILSRKGCKKKKIISLRRQSLMQDI